MDCRQQSLQNFDNTVHSAGETRFYGAFITAERMLLVKAALMQTVVSQEWADWMKGASTKVGDEAAAVKALVLDEKIFWSHLEVMTETFAPVVKLLRLADSNLPAASKVTALYPQHALPHMRGKVHCLVWTSIGKIFLR
jgi:hypothetical protein